MNALLKTVTLAGSLALVAPSLAAAQTACAQWDLSQPWIAVQGHYRVEFFLHQEGTKLSGIAWYRDPARPLVPGLFEHQLTTKAFGLDGRWRNGQVTGLIRGNSVQLNTSWGGVYVGDIDGTGRIDGTTYDKRDSTASATWFSNRRMDCRAGITVPTPWQSGATPLPRPESLPPRKVPDRTTEVLTAPPGWTPGPLRTAPKGIKGQEPRPNNVGAVTAIKAVTTPGTVPAYLPAEPLQNPSKGIKGAEPRASNLGGVAAIKAVTTAPQAAPPAILPAASSTDICRQGYVWRGAGPNDRVCVTRQSAARVAEENRTRAERVQPGGGAYGPSTCLASLVWREAFAGDGVCVKPEIRALVAEENRVGPSLRVR
jgi:hypothetical protein